jgi:hypothetical protein
MLDIFYGVRKTTFFSVLSELWLQTPNLICLFLGKHSMYVYIYIYTYEACPESNDTKVLNMHNTFNLQKRHC